MADQQPKSIVCVSKLSLGHSDQLRHDLLDQQNIPSAIQHESLPCQKE